MQTSGSFRVTSFEPTDFTPDVTTGLATGHAHLHKEFSGGIEGRSVAQFSAAFDQASGVGTYVAMESFEGSLDGRAGAFNFAHTATTLGGERLHELMVIVPTSGTGELVGLTGTGRLVIDDAGERVELDYQLDALISE